MRPITLIDFKRIVPAKPAIRCLRPSSFIWRGMKRLMAAFIAPLVGMELAQDREGTIADLARVLAHFKMPGDGLIPNYRKRPKHFWRWQSVRGPFLERVGPAPLNNFGDWPCGT